MNLSRSCPGTHTDSANVKVREGLLDIKTKVGQTPEGYEIFQPRGRLPFPVKKADLTTALSYLNVRTDLIGHAFTLEEVIKFARSNPDIVPVMIVAFSVSVAAKCAWPKTRGMKVLRAKSDGS